MLVSVRFRRRSALRFAWITSVLLAVGLGWGLARYDLGPPPPDRGDEPAAAEPAAPAEPAPARVDGRLTADSRGPETPVLDALAAPPAEPDAADEPVPSAPPPKPERPKSKKAAKAAEPVLEVVAEPPVEPVEEPAPAEPEPASPPSSGVLARARSADRLAEEHDADGAKREAAALLAEHPSYTGLAAALVADGADEVAAQLSALRVLQIAGEDSTTRDVARELRRSYSGTQDVAETIHRWGILKPRITSVEPSIEDGRQLIVNGTLENPDVVLVRRVRVEVEALDAGGNLLGKVEARVRPNVLAPGSQGGFQAVFKKLDPGSVLRTRANLVGWESEVSAPRREQDQPTATDIAD